MIHHWYTLKCFSFSQVYSALWLDIQQNFQNFPLEGSRTRRTRISWYIYKEYSHRKAQFSATSLFNKHMNSIDGLAKTLENTIMEIVRKTGAKAVMLAQKRRLLSQNLVSSTQLPHHRSPEKKEWFQDSPSWRIRPRKCLSLLQVAP